MAIKEPQPANNPPNPQVPVAANTADVPDTEIIIVPEDIPVQREGDVLVDVNSGEEYAIDPDSGFVSVNGIYTAPEDIDPAEANVPDGGLVEFTAEGDVVRSAQDLAAQQTEINQLVKNAQSQATLAQQMRQANSRDWRVKLRLAPGANYLYRASDGKGSQAGILQPLAVTDGVVFPYTPQITTAYRANYSSYDLTHSNFRGYFYQSSYVDDIQIQATFTAQDSAEAKYLLAVIHFFRSITKMFYGQDAERGAPPPLVFLQGLGQFQFNLHPCVVAQFNYNLPNDVDYIRADSPNIYNTSLLDRRDRQTVSGSPFLSAWQRLVSAGLSKGALTTQTSYVPTLGTDSPTYVPTKIDMTIILHPIQSRQQVSNNFSLKKYASGDLIKGGTNQPGAFW